MIPQGKPPILGRAGRTAGPLTGERCRLRILPAGRGGPSSRGRPAGRGVLPSPGRPAGRGARPSPAALVAAAGGLVLALMLFLTVSFHASPYYTGSDIVFVFAWTPLLLAGAGDVLSVDGVLRRRRDEPAGWQGTAYGQAAIDRRRFT